MDFFSKPAEFFAGFFVSAATTDQKFLNSKTNRTEFFALVAPFFEPPPVPEVAPEPPARASSGIDSVFKILFYNDFQKTKILNSSNLCIKFASNFLIPDPLLDRPTQSFHDK